MKKTLKMLVVAAIVATSFSSAAFAGVTIGAWGRALFVPVESHFDGEDSTVKSGYQTSWGGTGRIGFTIAGSSDNVGFQVDLQADSNSADQGPLGLNDQAKIWVKPMDMLKIEMGGRIFYDKYRGNTAFGTWDWIRTNITKGEDVTFSRVDVKNGALIEITPISALSIFAAVGGIQSSEGSTGAGAAEDLTADVSTGLVFQLGQYGLGYDFGIGTARVQYIGRGTVVDDELENDYGVIQAAVKLDKLMPALYVDLGATLFTDDEFGDTRIALYAKYNLGVATVHGLADVVLADDTAMIFGVGVDASVAGLGVGAEFRYANEFASSTGESAMTFAVSGTKGFSNGLFGVAFEGTTGTFATTDWAGTDKENADDMVWTLPIRAEYWF